MKIRLAMENNEFNSIQLRRGQNGTKCSEGVTRLYLFRSEFRALAMTFASRTMTSSVDESRATSRSRRAPCTYPPGLWQGATARLHQ